MSDELEELIQKCRALKMMVGVKTDELDVLKEKLRVFMIDSGIKTHDGVEIKRSFSFDTGIFKMDEKELAKAYIKEETITKIRDVVNKKGLQKDYPEIYRKYLLENTARLYGL